MSNPLSIILDPAQVRLSQDGLSTLVSGRDWDPTNWQDIWIDPVTNTCMLCPAPLYPDWVQSTSGIFTKWTLSNFTLTDSSNWSASINSDHGGPFMQYFGPSGNIAGLQGIGPSVGTNQPMVVEYFVQKTTNGKIEIIDFGWSNAGNGTTGPSFRVYSNGDFDAWLDGNLVGTYSGGGNSPDYFSQAQQVGTVLAGGAQSGQAWGYIRVMLIPYRDREMLVVSSGGASFCHTYQNLPDGVAGQTITPAANFWFYVPAGVSAEVRIAPLQFAASGYVCGYPTNWRMTPPSGSPTFDIFEALSDPTGGGELVSATMVTPATNPYSLANPTQIKLALTAGSAPNWTPFVYGCRAYYPEETSSTAALNLQILDYVLSFNLEVSDSIGGTRATMTLNQPAALAAAGAVGITTMCHRAIQVSDEVGMILNGVAEPPHWTDSHGFDAGAYDLNQEIEIEVRDMWKLAEEYIFSDPIPLDGMKLSDAYTMVAEMIGIPSSLIYVSSTAASFTLPFCPASGGDWGFLCDVGDKGSEILDRLHQTYASTWFHGFRPNGTNPPILSLIDPTDSGGLPSTASVTLYPDVNAMGATWQTTYRTYRQTILEPEANDLCVTGRDPRTNKPIVAHKADTASQTVTTAVASRPSNWLGFIRKYGWVDPSITTIDAAQYALNYLYDRLTPARQIIEFECEYLPGVWRGDLVTLNRPGEEEPVTVRIKTFSGVFEHVGTFGGNSTPDGVWRPCKYVGEVGSLICPLDVPGTSLTAISAAWHSLKAVSKQMIKEGGEIVARRPILNQQEF